MSTVELNETEAAVCEILKQGPMCKEDLAAKLAERVGHDFSSGVLLQIIFRLPQKGVAVQKFKKNKGSKAMFAIMA